MREVPHLKWLLDRFVRKQLEAAKFRKLTLNKSKCTFIECKVSVGVRQCGTLCVNNYGGYNWCQEHDPYYAIKKNIASPKLRKTNKVYDYKNSKAMAAKVAQGSIDFFNGVINMDEFRGIVSTYENALDLVNKNNS